jgi:hypothetical protein
MSKIFSGNKARIQDFMDITNLFFNIVTFNPWIIFATWLHLRAPQEKTKNSIHSSFKHSNIELFPIHTKSELGVLGSA